MNELEMAITELLKARNPVTVAEIREFADELHCTVEAAIVEYADSKEMYDYVPIY